MKKVPMIIVTSIALIVFTGIFLSGSETQTTQGSQVLSEQTEQPTPATTNSATSTMYASLTGDAFDKAYLADMLAHHQGALNMASWARTETKREEIETLAKNILSTQASEVQQMLDWQQKWGYVDGSDPHAGHVMESGDGMGAQMAAMAEKLYTLTGNEYDKEFLKQMIIHHQQAIDMSKYAETNANHQEVKSLAKAIIDVQEKEIADMKSWQQEWGY